MHAWQVCGHLLQDSARRYCTCHTRRLWHVRERVQPSSAARSSLTTVPTGLCTLRATVALIGVQVVWRNYIQAMRQAGFGLGVGVYVASGLLTYGANEGMRPPTHSCTCWSTWHEGIIWAEHKCMHTEHCHAFVHAVQFWVCWLLDGRGHSAERAAPCTLLPPMHAGLCSPYMLPGKQRVRGPAVSTRHAPCTHSTLRPHAEMADVIKTLTEAGLCSEVYHKELYLPAAALSGAGPQLPAVCNPRRTPSLAGRRARSRLSLVIHREASLKLQDMNTRTPTSFIRAGSNLSATHAQR